MTAPPTIRSEAHTTANSTLTAVISPAAGDLIVVWVANAESAPNLSVSASGGTATFSDGIVLGSAQLLGGSGGNAVLRIADTTNSLYNHVWAFRVLTCTATSITLTVSNVAGSYSTGVRRFGAVAWNPNGWIWPSATPVRTGTALMDNSATDKAVVWNEARSHLAGVGIAIANQTATKTNSVDWDQEAGPDYTSNTAGDAGDGGIAMSMGGTGGSTTNIAISYGAWDDGGIGGGAWSADTQVTFHGSSAAGSKAYLILYFAVQGTYLQLDGGGKGNTASGYSTTFARMKQGLARLKGKSATASKSKGKLKADIFLRGKSATVSDAIGVLTIPKPFPPCKSATASGYVSTHAVMASGPPAVTSTGFFAFM